MGVPMVQFRDYDAHFVDDNKMNSIYELFKTPHKCGAVIKLDDYWCDSPSVFRANGKWYMSFIEISKDFSNSGYESHLAESDDLIHWNYICPILKRTDDNSWDSRQIAAYAAFVDNDFNDSS